MKPKRLIPYIVVALAAGAGGYFAGRGVDDASPGRRAGIRTAVAASGSSGGAFGLAEALPARLGKLLGDEPLSAGNATEITSRILAEADPARRMAALALLLESMSPENARAVRQGFLDSTARTGRRHDGEWALMVRKLGEVLGEEGYREMGPEPYNLALAMEGWAAVDPDSAEAAMKADKSHHSDITNAWLTGLCRRDTDKALLVALTGKFPAMNAGVLMTQAINSNGIDGARDALQKALDASPVEAAASPNFRGLFDALAESMFHKNKTDGNPVAMLKWISEQKDQPYLGDHIISRGVTDTWQAGKPEEAIAFLEQMNQGREGDALRGGDSILQMLVDDPQSIGKLDDATFARAVALLPNNPQRTRAAAAILNSVNPDRAALLLKNLPP